MSIDGKLGLPYCLVLGAFVEIGLLEHTGLFCDEWLLMGVPLDCDSFGSH